MFDFEDGNWLSDSEGACCGVCGIEGGKQLCGSGDCTGGGVLVKPLGGLVRHELRLKIKNTYCAGFLNATP